MLNGIKLTGHFIDEQGYDMPDSVSALLFRLFELNYSRESSTAATIDEYSKIMSQIVDITNYEANNLVDQGKVAEALMATDSAKSAFFHSDLQRRVFPSVLKDFILQNKIRTQFFGWTSIDTLRSFNKFNTSRILISYYIAENQLFVFLMGNKKDRPYVCVVKETNEILQKYKSLHSRLVTVVSSNPSKFIQQKDELNEILWLLGVTNGEILQKAIELFDKSDSLFIIPHSFLHVLPLHIAFNPKRSDLETFICFNEVHFAPSLGIMASKEANISSPVIADRRRQASQNRFVIDEDNIRTGKAEKEFLKVLTSVALERDTVSFEKPTVNFLKNSNQNLRSLHFSCHGTSSDRNWGESLLHFEGKQLLNATDLLAQVDLTSTDLTVLSACETGLLLDLDPKVDRYAGLDMAFWICGSRSVLSSCWAIEDNSAFLFNMLFYHFLLFEKNSPAYAYRMAVVCLRDGIWQALILDRLQAMKSGRWPANDCVHLRPELERLASRSEDAFSNVFFWAPYKFLGF